MPFLSKTGPSTSLMTCHEDKKKSNLSDGQLRFAVLITLGRYIPHLVSPQCFLFHSRYDLCVDVHVQVKLEAEALLTGVLQGNTQAELVCTGARVLL